MRGTNSYLVQVGDTTKHVSGDCLTVDRAESQSDNNISNNTPRSADGNIEIQDLGQEAMLEDDEDAMSVKSDSTVNSIYGTARPQGNIRNNRLNRNHRRMMLERLDRPALQNSRLRSGN